MRVSWQKSPRKQPLASSFAAASWFLPCNVLCWKQYKWHEMYRSSRITTRVELVRKSVFLPGGDYWWRLHGRQWDAQTQRRSPHRWNLWLGSQLVGRRVKVQDKTSSGHSIEAAYWNPYRTMCRWYILLSIIAFFTQPSVRWKLKFF